MQWLSNHTTSKLCVQPPQMGKVMYGPGMMMSYTSKGRVFVTWLLVDTCFLLFIQAAGSPIFKCKDRPAVEECFRSNYLDF